MALKKKPGSFNLPHVLGYVFWCMLTEHSMSGSTHIHIGRGSNLGGLQRKGQKEQKKTEVTESDRKRLILIEIA